MTLERTFSIIKPDATRRNLTGAINAKFEAAGLRIVAQKRIHLTKEQAGVFYAVHAERPPFYDELCEFMASAPIVAQVLEGEGAMRKTAKSWAQQTQQTQRPARSVPILLNPLAKIRFTVLTRLKRLRLKSLTSSRVLNWLAKPV